MNVNSARIDRLLMAAALGLIIAIIAALSIETAPSAAIARGDFPAFYTIATLANRGEGVRLYDLETQRQVQNELWPSLQGSVLPVAYPAFLAFCLEPLAELSPSNARLVWILGMVLSVLVAGTLIARSTPSLRGLTWQVIVTSFLFAPLFLGVLGGQIVGLSVLLYSACIFLVRMKEKAMEIPLGVMAGLWMYKPHFALAVVVVFLARRKWIAIGAWLVTCGLLWTLGASVAGVDWLSRWYGFAREFARIDLMSNAPQMTGIVPFLYVLQNGMPERWASGGELWDQLTIISALVVPSVLLLVSRRCGENGAYGTLLAVGPLLVLFAPAVNFYDLALAALPLALLFQPSQRLDRLLAVALIALSQIAIALKDGGMKGSCFGLAICVAYLFIKAIARERAHDVAERRV